MIEKNRTYRTRDGREVRIYATDGGSYTPIMGATLYTSKEGKLWWESARWTEDGAYDVYGRETKTDLIEVRPRHKRTLWLNVHVNKSVIAHNFREEADKLFCKDVAPRLACIKVELDFAEGDGL
jgi:hypothetical protein